ncbi:MAG: hypothetical protein EBR82_48600 [Caulobacteraceae bacterium]|nr:hypothetical protein [Caulobacteraceae bacterium]
MTQDYPKPITPSPELVRQWWVDAQKNLSPDVVCWVNHIATRAAQWGADQELDACCKVLKDWGSCLSPDLRAARRPKPPSLKEQALLAIDTAVADDRLSADVANVVRRALEQLDD